MLTDHLKELLAILGKGASLEGQVEAGPTGGAELKSPMADNLADFEVKSPGTDNSAVNGPKIGKLCPYNWYILRQNWLLYNVVTSCLFCPSLEYEICLKI